MKTSLFSRICNKPLPWYLYLASFVAFCAAEVVVKNALSISITASLGVLPVIILYLVCLFVIKALYYALTAPVPPPITPSVPADSEIAEIDVPASTPAKHKPTTAIILLLCLCVLSSGICYYIGSTLAANQYYSIGYEEGQSAGYESGVSDGYQSGYDLGTSEGYDSGYNDGYTSGKLDAIAAANAAAEASRQAAAEAAAKAKAEAEAKRQAAIEAAKNAPAIKKYLERGGYGVENPVESFLNRGK